MPSILIADDHEVVRRGMRQILEDLVQDAAVVEAGTAAETLAHVAERPLDLVILDIMMPGSNVVDVLTDVKRLKPSLPVLILTAVSEDQYASRTLAAGADGYITKRYAADELANAVQTLLRGEQYLSQEAIRALTGKVRGEDERLPHERLSPRELEVLLAIAQGKAVKEVAAQLDLSDKTVATYMVRIREKTGLQSYVDMARYALQHGLVQ